MKIIHGMHETQNKGFYCIHVYCVLRVIAIKGFRRVSQHFVSAFYVRKAICDLLYGWKKV